GLSQDIADETMRNFRELADGGRGILMITHDIDVALQVADRIAVFYDGRTVDECDRDSFLRGGDALKHPYTRALWAALPQNGFKAVSPEDFMEEAAP
ncbi:MAG: hypothetical protein IKR21_00575, partial [Oscillospiraceae bacterium]|nr:hypothetical protein [Oscillospiraceae bacterium]